MKVRDAFANAYRELRDAVLPQYQHIQSHCSSFLGRILLIPVEVVKYRQVVEKRWQLQPFSPSSSASSSSANEDTHQLSHSVTEQRQSTTQQPADDKHVSHTLAHLPASRSGVHNFSRQWGHESKREGYHGGSPTTVQAWQPCPLWELSPSHPILV